MTIGRTNSGGKSAAVEGGYTVRFLDENEQNFFIFSCPQGGRIQDVAPYPTAAGKSFVAWTRIKNDISTRVSFPFTPVRDEVLYAYFILGSSTLIMNLGNANPGLVTFTKTSAFPSEAECYEEVVVDGNYFAKFTPWYFKTQNSGNTLTGIQISNVKEDDSFQPFDCFLDENDNLLPYILIGQYRMSSSSEANSVDASAVNMTISQGRALAKLKGSGYQIMDAAMQMFWRYLALAVSERVNFNPGTGVASYLGLKRMNEGGWWIDGCAQNNGTYLYSNKPSKYTDNPTASTDGYTALVGYTMPNVSGGCVSELGFDSAHPSINFPSAAVTDSSYGSYYCDGFWYSSGNHPLYVLVGSASAFYGLFFCAGGNAWSYVDGVRLCYKPIA